jgi:glycopeptide antibiotics resistance protein
VRLILRLLAGAYLAYIAVVVLLLTPALNFLPGWYVKKQFGRELYSEIILFNPFTIALEVRGASMPEKDGDRFVDLRNATVNL